MDYHAYLVGARVGFVSNPGFFEAVSLGADAAVFAVNGVEVIFAVFVFFEDHGVRGARLGANNVAGNQFARFIEGRDGFVDVFGDLDFARYEVVFATMNLAGADPDGLAWFHEAGFLSGDGNIFGAVEAADLVGFCPGIFAAAITI